MHRERRPWRGFLIGALLLPLNILWVLYMEHIAAHGPIPSTISLFFNVIFILFFLALANAAIHRLRPAWLTVSDPNVLYGYYNGSSTLYQPAVLSAWLTPALWWTGFILLLIFLMICISVLVRSQWADRERLTFPIIQLPLAIADPATPLWRNPVLWIGFAIAGSIDLLNGLHYIFPSVPYLSIAPTLDSYSANDLGRYITDMPWAAIGWLPVTFYPAVIGICFLMPLDLLLACVFFFWWKAMFVLSAAFGLSQGYAEALSKSVFPYHNEQMFGSYLAIAIGPLLVGRR